MKTLPIIAFLAALAAFLFAPVTIDFSGFVLFAAGLAGIFTADYTRRVRPGGARPATVVRLAPAARAARELELAA